LQQQQQQLCTSPAAANGVPGTLWLGKPFLQAPSKHIRQQAGAKVGAAAATVWLVYVVAWWAASSSCSSSGGSRHAFTEQDCSTPDDYRIAS
jgi:hypothetical protein